MDSDTDWQGHQQFEEGNFLSVDHKLFLGLEKWSQAPHRSAKEPIKKIIGGPKKTKNISINPDNKNNKVRIKLN